MAIRTQSRPNPSNIINIALIGAASAAIAVSAIFISRNADQDSSVTAQTLSPSFAGAELSANDQFKTDMAMHEALTEAVFGPLARDLGVELETAIAEHSAAFPLVLAATVVAPHDAGSQLSTALAEHDALITPFLQSHSGGSLAGAEVAAAIAEHEALIAPFLVTQVQPRDLAGELAFALAQHDALIEPFVS